MGEISTACLCLTRGYWQIPLDESSQLLTTFNTPFGRYCFTRMPFAIKSAQEVLQKRISQHFDDIEGVATDIDDIFIWGSDEDEHDRRLKATLQKCEEINLTLNERSSKWKKSSTVVTTSRSMGCDLMNRK